MRHRILVALFLVTACAPKDPASTEGDASSTSDAGTTAAASTSSTGEPTTTAASTSSTSSASTGGSTTSEPPVCPWYLPENQGLVFCPPPAGLNADVGGTTPYGPVTLRYAHFGLFLCANCPTASEGSLRLYADPPTLGEASGDFLGFEWLSANGLQPASFGPSGQVGGQPVAFDMLPTDLTLTDLALPPDEATAPPLDEATPPVVSGTLHITGNGWDVQGSFTAPLCTALDWTPFCE